MKNLVNVNDDNRAKVEFALAIDFNPLWEAIRKKVGWEVRFDETPEIHESRNKNISIEWQSENLKDSAGVMKTAYKDLRICNFGGMVTKSKDTGELLYWCSVHWGFEYVDGGSNGTKITYARFTESAGWQWD